MKIVGFFFSGWCGGGVWCEVGKVCTKWVGVHIIAEEMKIYSYIHVGKFPYPQYIS
jgi:hypothetical protein